MSTSIPPPPGSPGWYADPFDPELLRYSDGNAWTRHTQLMPHGWVAAAPARPASLPWWQTWWAVVPGLLLCAPFGLIGLWKRPGLSLAVRGGVSAACVLFLTIALVTGDEPTTDDETPAVAVDDGDDRTEATPTPTPTPATSSPTVETAMSTVPRVVGLAHRQAKQELRSAGLVVETIERMPSAKPRGTVLQQSVRRGESLLSGSGVSMTVAVPYPRAPLVAGSTRRSATRALEQAGFEVEFVTETVTSGRDGVALRQIPPAADRLPPGAVVTVVLASVVAPAPPPPPPASNCTPGYDPCLTPASDYDCAGGSGDGPAYATGPIRVTGDDPYGLDADGDGIACDT